MGLERSSRVWEYGAALVLNSSVRLYAVMIFSLFSVHISFIILMNLVLNPRWLSCFTHIVIYDKCVYSAYSTYICVGFYLTLNKVSIDL